MPVSPRDPVAKGTGSPTSPRRTRTPQASPPPIAETAFRMELSSGSYLVDPATVLTTMPLVPSPTVAPGHVRIELSYAAVGVCDIYRHEASAITLSRGDLLPLSSGFTATGRFIAAGPNSSFWNVLSAGSCVLVFRSRATRFDSLLDVPIKYCYLIPENSKVQLLATAAFTGSLCLKAIARGQDESPSAGRDSVLIINGDSANAMMTAFMFKKRGYSVKVLVTNTQAIPIYERMQVEIDVFNITVLDRWLQEGRKFDIVIASTDWQMFANIQVALKLCKPFASTFLVHGPSSHLPRFSKIQLHKFADSLVPVVWLSVQTEVFTPEEVASYIRDAVLFVNEHKLSAELMLNQGRHTVGSIREYVRRCVQDVPCGLSTLELR